MSAMSPQHALLLRRLELLHGKLHAGDAGARALVARTKARAKRGDKKAAMVFNTLASIHWRASQNPRWAKLEAFYYRLGANDMKAWEIAKRIKARAEQRDSAAQRVFAALKAIHNERKISVWYPGAPQKGLYPMPNVHRAGISIPSARAGMMHIEPEWSIISGTINDGRFLPLTPDAVQSLLSVIRAAALSIPQEMPVMNANPMYESAAPSSLPAPPSPKPAPTPPAQQSKAAYMLTARKSMFAPLQETSRMNWMKI